MILLSRLVLEAMSNPKGIILAGGAGAGKTYVVKNLLGDLDEKTGIFTPKDSNLKFQYLNPDDIIEKEDTDLGTAMGVFREKFANVQEEKENILWDTTAANIKNTLSQMPGYDKFMVMVYTHPMVSILQNAKRDRTLPINAVLKTWDSVYDNIKDYKSEFGNNFVLIKNIMPGYEKEIAEFDKAVKGGKETLKTYFENLLSSDPEKFKSSFEKPFEFDKSEIGQAFEQALPQTSYNEKEDESILKAIKKEFQKEYLKKNEDPGKDFLERKIKSARNTKERNEKNYNENIEGIINKLISPEFEKLTLPTDPQEVKTRFNSFLK